MKKCVIVGAGTYGQVYAEYLRESYDILGYVDDNLEIHNTSINGIQVLGDFKFLLETIQKDVRVFIPIGNTKVRSKLIKAAREKGFDTPNYIHSTADIHSSVKIGEYGVYILQGTIIMPLSIIENNVMISAGTVISHHSTIKKGTFISFGVNIGASLTLEERTYIGIGATVMTGVKTVGTGSLIGAGAVIIKDVPDYAVVVGNPGKIIKYNNE